MQQLTPEEIRFLYKTNGHRVDDTAYIKMNGGLVEKLTSCGYLITGTKAQSLSCADMSIIRKLLKDKGLKAGGKKVDLVQRILQSYPASELENADIPKRFVLTVSGEQVINENSALLYYFDAFGATNILEPEQIISAQNLHHSENKLDILILLFKERAATENDTGKKRAITEHLRRLYSLNHDDALARETELEVERLDKLWEEEREQEARKLDSVLGISLEERRRLAQKAIEEMGDGWEKELDAKNRAKAGIE